jgi:hypothetical protein
MKPRLGTPQGAAGKRGNTEDLSLEEDEDTGDDGRLSRDATGVPTCTLSAGRDAGC